MQAPMLPGRDSEGMAVQGRPARIYFPISTGSPKPGSFIFGSYVSASRTTGQTIFDGSRYFTT